MLCGLVEGHIRRNVSSPSSVLYVPPSYKTTQHHNPQDHDGFSHLCENLRSQTLLPVSPVVLFIFNFILPVPVVELL
jgi:hypothetical protein